MRNRIWSVSMAVALMALFLSAPAGASVILGTGTGALLGGDLTDPEDDINDNVPTSLPYYGTGYNWVDVRASAELYFSPGSAAINAGWNEAALDLFDNKVGGGEAKWFDMTPTGWVAVRFDQAEILTHFTITSGNDSLAYDRNPDIWYIEGSNDSTDGQDGAWTTIFAYSNDGTSPFTADDQVILYASPAYASVQAADYALPAAYEWIRYRSASAVGGAEQLGELEFFTPEPTTMCLLAVGGMMVLRRRRRA